MRLKTILASTLFVTFVSQAQASTLSVLGRVGYEHLKADDASSDEASKGFSLGAVAQYHFLDLGVASFYGSGGLQYVRTSKTFDLTPSQGTSYDGSFKTVSTGLIIPLEVGASFTLIPLLTLQAGAGWDQGIWGEAKTDIPTVKLASGGVYQASTTQTKKLVSYGAFTASARVLLTPLPFFRTGLEFAYQNGSVKAENNPSTDFAGYGIRLVGGLDF